MTGSSRGGKQPSILHPDSLSKLTIFLSRSLSLPRPSFHSFLPLLRSSRLLGYSKLSLSKLIYLYLFLNLSLCLLLWHIFLSLHCLSQDPNISLSVSPTPLTPSFSDKQTNELKSIGREHPRSVTAWPAT